MATATAYSGPWVLVAAAGAYGLLVRIWLLAHLGLFGDEAVVGLMGRGIQQGHLDAFFWSSNYGGGGPSTTSPISSRTARSATGSFTWASSMR